MAATFHFKLVTPAATLVSEDVTSVTMPTEMGQITILAHHLPLVALLRHGELLVRTLDQRTEPLAVAGGIIEMSPKNELTVLADSAEHASTIDLAATEQRAKELAEQVEQQTELDVTSYKLLLRELERERARMAVATKWKR